MKRFIGDFAPEAYEFMEQHADEHWDFKTCVYPGGEAYGIEDGKQCRKAPEGSVPEKAKAGQASAGAGTAHELALAKELAGSFDKIVAGKGSEEIYNKNMEISKASGETATRVAKQNAEDLRNELKKRGMESIDEIIWTAQLRGDNLAKAAGVEGLSDKNNQSDILVKGKDKDGNEMVYGVSLKVATSSSTKYPNDIPFFNGGLKKEAERLGVSEVSENAAKSMKKALKDIGVKSATAAAAKKEIRENEETKAKADAAGKRILEEARDGLVSGLSNKSAEEVRAFLSSMTGAPSGAGRNLPTLKLTGYSSGKKTTKIEDAIEGKVAKAIAGAKDFQIEKAGASAVKIVADGVPVMKVRVKWESQALGSSLKISGESP